MIKKTKEHLLEAHENYFQHMFFAFKISFQLLTGSLMAFIHALLPFLFTKGASEKIKILYFFIENRKKN